MNPEDLKRLQANYTPYNLGTTKKKSGRGGTPTSLISEAGGLVGAAKGATIGASIGSVVPGVGTVIGGIVGGAIGGFAGGTAGRALENKVRDDEFRITQALGEGVSSGISGAIGGGFVGKAATVGAKGATAGATAGAKAGTSANKLTKVGEGLKRSVINPQVKATPFAAQEQAEIVKIMSKVPGKSAQAKIQNMPAEFNKINGELNSILQANTNTATRTNIQNVIKAKSGDIPQFVGGDKAYQTALRTELRELTSKFSGNKITPSQIQQAKSNIAGKMDGIFNKISKGADLNPKEASRLAVWQGLDDQIIKLAPEAKALTLTQSGFYKAAPGILKASQKTAGIPILGIRSAGLETGIQSGKYMAGEAIGATGNLASKIPKISPVAKTMLPAQAIQGMSNSEPTLEDTLMQQSDFGGGFEQQSFEQVQTSPYPRENLLYDLQRDPQNADKYIEYYQTMESIFGAPAERKMSATERQRATTAQSGIRSLGTLEETLMRDPGAFQRQALPNPLGITARLTGTSEVRAATDNIVDVIARLRSGAAITDSEAARFARLLPQAGDSQEAARFKLDNVRAELENVISGGASAPNTLEELLMQRGAM